MINFENISKKFRKNFWEKDFIALDKVSFQIAEGDMVGFLGANGAGKTTLIKILMDFSRQDEGFVHFQPKLGINNKEIKANIGYLPERAYLYPHLTGREFLRFIVNLNGISYEDGEERIAGLTKKMSISEALDRPIGGYSKGMQQRVGFISSIIHQPKLIILDEPLSGLDPLGRREFKKILKELNQSGVTIFFSSHVVADVEEICNKVVFIENGKLVYEGSIDSLIVKHSNDLYMLKFFKDDQLSVLHVHEQDKNKTLCDLIDSGANILEIEKEKPSLEEIIYKIKK